jgi:regulation of enolase protein 1 (concanavalin A-like superfamily)
MTSGWAVKNETARSSNASRANANSVCEIIVVAKRSGSADGTDHVTVVTLHPSPDRRNVSFGVMSCSPPRATQAAQIPLP